MRNTNNTIGLPKSHKKAKLGIPIQGGDLHLSFSYLIPLIYAYHPLLRPYHCGCN